ncbi:hypothetical protein QBC37DRAFT_450623 [Rhypophila decipiens]|uniref:Uncharacterized protein n=1 Tax=Rhypophila decipiens TaxID=261697 RepID=A0AAN7B3Y1_9PEZI|nr:hypothetical protein QBC37DRAFT_450623 [Rhypophila decipiens]
MTTLSELQGTQSVLQATQSDLEDSHSELIARQSDLEASRQYAEKITQQARHYEEQLRAALSTLQATQSDLRASQSNFEASQSELRATELNLQGTRNRLVTTQSELAKAHRCNDGITYRPLDLQMAQGMALAIEHAAKQGPLSHTSSTAEMPPTDPVNFSIAGTPATLSITLTDTSIELNSPAKFAISPKSVKSVKSTLTAKSATKPVPVSPDLLDGLASPHKKQWAVPADKILVGTPHFASTASASAPASPASAEPRIKQQRREKTARGMPSFCLF